jgi:16S rRNA (cytosine967-C5)-methyltransferase
LEPTARSIAAHVLDRVYGEGAFASAVLDSALERYPELDPRERALATELAYGALRTAPYLETRLSKHVSKGNRKLEATVAHLLVAAYRLLFLESPAFAAVSEAVRRSAPPAASGLAPSRTAFLRRLSEDVVAPTDGPRSGIAARESVSPELRLGARSLRRRMGRTSSTPPRSRRRIADQVGCRSAW